MPRPRNKGVLDGQDRIESDSGKELDPDFVDFNSVNRRYHFPARTYLPFRAIFNQIDPLAMGNAGNGRPLYLFVMANPLMMVDPDGRQTWQQIRGHVLDSQGNVVDGPSAGGGGSPNWGGWNSLYNPPNTFDTSQQAGSGFSNLQTWVCPSGAVYNYIDLGGGPIQNPCLAISAGGGGGNSINNGGGAPNGSDIRDTLFANNDALNGPSKQLQDCACGSATLKYGADASRNDNFTADNFVVQTKPIIGAAVNFSWDNHTYPPRDPESYYCCVNTGWKQEVWDGKWGPDQNKTGTPNPFGFYDPVPTSTLEDYPGSTGGIAFGIWPPVFLGGRSESFRSKLYCIDSGPAGAAQVLYTVDWQYSAVKGNGGQGYAAVTLKLWGRCGDGGSGPPAVLK